MRGSHCDSVIGAECGKPLRHCEGPQKMPRDQKKKKEAPTGCASSTLFSFTVLEQQRSGMSVDEIVLNDSRYKMRGKEAIWGLGSSPMEAFVVPKVVRKWGLGQADLPLLPVFPSPLKQPHPNCASVPSIIPALVRRARKILLERCGSILTTENILLRAECRFSLLHGRD